MASVVGVPVGTAAGADPLASENTVSVGDGSYTTARPGGTPDPPTAGGLSESVQPPVQSNTWWGGEVFRPADAGFSGDAMYSPPMGVDVKNGDYGTGTDGLAVFSSDDWTQDVRTSTGAHGNYDSTPGLDVGHADTSFTECSVDGYGDWHTELLWGEGTDTTMRATVVKGSPFVFCEFEGNAEIRAVNGLPKWPNVESNGQQLGADSVSVWGYNEDYVGLTVTHSPSDADVTHRRHFGVYAPPGATWDNVSADGVTADTITSELAGEGYLTVAALPGQNEALLNELATYAHNAVVDTRIDWAYRQRDADGDVVSEVETTFTFETEDRTGSSDGGGETVAWLYPHQHKHTDVPLTSYTAWTERGTAKLFKGVELTTTLTYPGILPWLPSALLDTGQQSELSGLLDDLMAEYRETDDETGEEYLWPYSYGVPSDTYFGGKDPFRLGNVAPVADELDHSGADALLDAIGTRVGHRVETDDQFTYDGRTYTTRTDDGNVRELFQYDPSLGTFLPHDGNFGSVTDLNDHHFHFGYWVFGGSIVGLNEDPTAEETWVDRYGEMIDLLIRDYANWERPANDGPGSGAAPTATTPRDAPKDAFPFLRCFDPWEGHSWASGTASGSGTGQESSSEAINAYAAMIRWGETRLRHAETADERAHAREILETGIFLYTQEITAVLEYWFDVADDTHPEDWGEDLSNAEDIAVSDGPFDFASRVYSNGYDRGLYFAITPVHLYGINYLPVGGHSFYLGQDRQYAAEQWETIRENRATPHWGYEQNPEDFPGGWTTCMHCYRALSEPSDAVDVYDDEPENAADDGGNTKAFAYTWTRTLDNHGTPNEAITADTTFFRVFDSDHERTYAVYNPRTEPIDVTFSDGYTIEAVPPGDSAVETGPIDADSGPAAPTGLTKGQDNSYGLELSWDPSDDPALFKYRIDVNGQPHSETFEPTAVVGDLEPGTTYQIDVRAVDDADRVSAPTTITHTTTTGDNAPPEPPRNVATAGSTSTTTTVAWDAGNELGTGIDHYTIQYRALPAADGESPVAWENAATRAATIEHATVFGLTADTEYEFRVTATDRAGNESDPSAAVTATLPTGEADEQTPLGGTPTRVPGRVELEGYDDGPDGAAYHDTDEGNTGYQDQGVDFRTDEDVDVTQKGDAYAVGWTEENEWLEYTVRVEQAGTYEAALRYAFDATGTASAGPISILVDGARLLGPIELDQTGGWNAGDYETVDLGSLSLPEGRHTLQVFFESGWPEVDFLELVPQDGSADRTAPTAPDFDDGTTATATSVDLSWSGASDADSAIDRYELYQFVPRLDRSAWSVSASDGWNDPGLAVDANGSSQWASGVSMAEADITYEIDFGASQRIERLVIQHGVEIDVPPELVVEISDDGESWQELATVTGELTIDYAFDPVTTRHLRLRETTGTKDEWWKMQDIKIYAPPASGVGQWDSIDRLYDPDRTTRTVTGLTAGQSYDFAVEAVDAFGNRSERTTTTVETVSPDTDQTAPSAPEKLRATARTQTSLDLAWDAATDNVGVGEYVVYQDGTEVARTEGTTATVDGLSRATGYTVAVETVDSNGNVSQERATETIWTANTDGQAPYTEPIRLPATIPAVAFDYGGQDVAYSDADPDNKGPSGGVRADTGVDVIQSATGETRIGYVEPGEWLEYTVEVPETGSYTLAVDARRSGGPVHFEVDGTTVSGDRGSGSFEITATGENAVTGVQLEQGVHTLRFAVDSDAAATFDIDGFTVSRPVSGGSGESVVDPSTMTATATLADPVVDQTAVYDGDETTSLVLGPPNIDQTEYGLTIDFGGQSTVDTVEIVAGNALDYPKSFTVEYDDGGTWVEADASVTLPADDDSTEVTTTLSFDPVTTRRLRIVETDDSTARYWNVAELRALDGGSALDRSGWTVTRTDVDGSTETQDADAVVDGKTGTANRWQSRQTSIASKDMAVEIALGSQQSLSKLDLVHSSDGDTPNTIDLEYSPDGSTWETARSGLSPSAETTITFESPITATKLRLDERDDQTEPNWWSLEEVTPYTAPSDDGGSDDTTPPEPPASVTVPSVTDTALTVEWEGSPSADVARYDVTVGDQTIQTVGRSATVTGLAAGTSYDASVAAVDTAGNTSTAVTATATTEVAVDYTQQFTSVGTDSGRIEFAPDATVQSASAEYRINGGSAATVTLSTVDGETRYTGTLPETLSGGDVIRYSITYTRADQQVVTDEYEVQFAGDTVPPAPPTDFLVTDYTDTTVSLSWTAASDDESGLAGYDLYVDGSERVTGIAGTQTTVEGLSPRTDYEFGLRAVDNAGNTSTVARTAQRTEPSSDTTAPPTPGDLTVTGAGTATLTVTWSGVEDGGSGLAGYELSIAGPSADRTIRTTDTSTAITDLSADTEFTVSVVAVDAFDNRSEPATVSARTAVPPRDSTLTTPTSLAATPGATTASVSWAEPDDPGTGIDYYVVERRRDGEPVDSRRTDETSTELTGLTPETTYTIAVRAVDTVGATATATTEITTTTQTDSSVDAPTNLSAATDSTALTLSWNPVSDESGLSHYRVAVDGTRRVETATTSATIENLSPATTYEVAVTAVDAAGNEATTTREFATDADTGVDAPTGLSTTVGESTVEVSWDAVDDPSGIEDYTVVALRTGAPVAETATTGTTVTVAGLAPGTAYTFEVTARDGVGNAATATTAATTAGDQPPAPEAPANLSVEGRTVSTATLSWTASPSAVDHYAVQVGGQTVVWTAGTTAEIDGLDPGTEYDVSVVAVTGTGLGSDPTPVQRVTTASLTRSRVTDAADAWRRDRAPTDEAVPRGDDDRVDYGTAREMVAAKREDEQE